MPVTIAEMQATIAPQFNLPISQLSIHQIAPIPRLTESGLTRETIEHLLQVSDHVVALWIGPQAVMVPHPSVRSLCEAVEARNTQMRQVIDLPERSSRSTRRPLLRQKNEKQLLDTFGKEANSRRPFVKPRRLRNGSIASSLARYDRLELQVK
ncbi:hypothetical protein BCR35DRAFT_314377 [Leucosporidium creatinivorum]|uniref:Uncharacterized protein n=1 Tax=Leucosporidium creatinivorum TaxID=106004 RepID=A0A1Y2F053_9BASI|nr:hypothetical protein BCR35DRAFT_314377 [Leucosporidium creatinivorum]